MKTAIFNLIILDESGSMCCVHQQTINGCNETINTIKASQKKFCDTQNHYVSIYAFQSGGDRPSRYLIKNMPAADVRHITSKDYDPDGCTPLYDAVGETLADLKATVQTHELGIGSVTIITDGEENSSRHYTQAQVAKMISALKEMGWNFNFIGANIDVQRYAQSLNIDNALEFQQDDEGTRNMFERERECRMAYNERLDEAIASCCADDSCMPEEVYRDRLKKASKGYFDA